MASLHDYINLMQFRILSLLALSTLAGFAIAYDNWSIHLLPLLVFALIGVFMGGMGAELLNKVLEIDIDSKMERASSRASVRGSVSPLFGIALGATLVILGVEIGGLANWSTSLMIALEVIFYVLIYTAILKRRSRFSIIIGGLAGSFCVWAGVTAATGTITLAGAILGVLVLLWIPGHIWSLASRFKEDYVAAGVPMLTAVESPRKGVMTIASFNILLALISLFLSLFLNTYYTEIITIPLLLMLYLSLRVIANRSTAWTLFMFSSPYLAFVFFAVIIARLI